MCKALFSAAGAKTKSQYWVAGYRYNHTDWQWLETGEHINNITWNPGEPTYNVKPSEDFLRLLPGGFGDAYSVRNKPLPMICEHQILFKK